MNGTRRGRLVDGLHDVRLGRRRFAGRVEGGVDQSPAVGELAQDHRRRSGPGDASPEPVDGRVERRRIAGRLRAPEADIVFPLMPEDAREPVVRMRGHGRIGPLHGLFEQVVSGIPALLVKAGAAESRRHQQDASALGKGLEIGPGKLHGQAHPVVALRMVERIECGNDEIPVIVPEAQLLDARIRCIQHRVEIPVPADHVRLAGEQEDVEAGFGGSFRNRRIGRRAGSRPGVAGIAAIRRHGDGHRGEARIAAAASCKDQACGRADQNIPERFHDLPPFATDQYGGPLFPNSKSGLFGGRESLAIG